MSVGLTFRTELFMVKSMIAWTYLLHAWFRCAGLDDRLPAIDGTIETTQHKAERYWDLKKCLQHPRCPISPGAKKNLESLTQLRDEIVHRSTVRIDDAVSAKLQACCLNFNEASKGFFAPQDGRERRFPIALQFVTVSADQRAALKKAAALPAPSELIDAFEHQLYEEEYREPVYRYRVAFVPIGANRAPAADEIVQFVKADSDEAQQISRILLKKVNKRCRTAGQVLKKFKARAIRNSS